MLASTSVLPIPRLLAGRLDAAASAFLADAGPKIDFSQPRGEAALVPADSVSWRIFKNQIALFIGGVTAVLLELAEPKVRDGVWQHSSFRNDALKRMQRTGLAAMVTVYGARSQAEQMIAGVVKRHGSVTGRTVEGEAYEANDTELLDWVQATASYGFMQAYHTYVSPLTQAERDAFLVEARPAAELYGATGPGFRTAARGADGAYERPARLVAGGLRIPRHHEPRACSSNSCATAANTPSEGSRGPPAALAPRQAWPRQTMVPVIP
jgi:hypothetical protein